MTPYEEGKQAYREDCAKGPCPYPWKTDDWKEWWAGYDDAESAACYNDGDE